MVRGVNMVTEVKVDGTYGNSAFKELIGSKIGDLTVVAYKGYRKVEKRRGKARKVHFFTCVCKCGNIVYLTLHEVQEQNVKSCGLCKDSNKEEALNEIDSVADSVANYGSIVKEIHTEYSVTPADAGEINNKHNIKAVNAAEINIAEKKARKERAENSVINDNTVSIHSKYPDYSRYDKAIGFAGKALKKLIGKKCGHIVILGYSHTLVNNTREIPEYKIMFKGRCTCGSECDVSLDEIISGKDLICTACAKELGITQTVKDTKKNKTNVSFDNKDINLLDYVDTPNIQYESNNPLEKYVIPVRDIFAAYKTFAGADLTGRRIANICIEAFQRDENSSTSYMIVKCDCGEKFVITNRALTFAKKEAEKDENIKFINHSNCHIHFPNRRSVYLKYFSESHNAPMIDRFSDIGDIRDLINMHTDSDSKTHNKGAEDTEEKACVSHVDEHKNTEEIKGVIDMKINDYIVRNDGKLDVDATFNRCIGAVIAMSTAKMDSYSVAEYTVNNFEVKIKNNAAGLFAKQFMDIVKGYESMQVLRDEMIELLIKHYLQKE